MKTAVEILKWLKVNDVASYGEVIEAYGALMNYNDDHIVCLGEGIYYEELEILDKYIENLIQDGKNIG